MAIQPIDLQTLYTQMDKVSKNVVHQQQQAQLQGAMQVDGLVKKDIQKSPTVEQMEKQESMSSVKDGHNSNDEPGKTVNVPFNLTSFKFGLLKKLDKPMLSKFSNSIELKLQLSKAPL